MMGSVPVPQRSLMGSINLLTPQQRVGAIPDSMLAPKPNLIGAIRQRMRGGPVKKIPEQLYLVGEKGPEKYVPKKGIPEMIGVNGPEVRAFPKDGTIIPHHKLTGKAQEAMEGFMGPLKRRALGGPVSGTRLGQTADDFYRAQDLNAGLSGLAQKDLEAFGVGLGGLNVIPHSWEKGSGGFMGRAPVASDFVGSKIGGGTAVAPGGAGGARSDWDKPGLISTIRQQKESGGLSPDQAASMMASLNAGLSPEDVSRSGSAFWALNHGQKPIEASPLDNFVQNTPTPKPLEPMGPPVPADLKKRQVDAKIAEAGRKVDAQKAQELAERAANARDSTLGSVTESIRSGVERANNLFGQDNPLLSSKQRQSLRDEYFNHLDDLPGGGVSLGPESKSDMMKRAQSDPLFEGYFKKKLAQKKK